MTPVTRDGFTVPPVLWAEAVDAFNNGRAPCGTWIPLINKAYCHSGDGILNSRCRTCVCGFRTVTGEILARKMRAFATYAMECGFNISLRGYETSSGNFSRDEDVKVI